MMLKREVKILMKVVKCLHDMEDHQSNFFILDIPMKKIITMQGIIFIFLDKVGFSLN